MGNAMLRRTVAALAALTMLVGGCTTNPATGKRTFTLLSWEEEMAMGAEAAPQMLEQFGGEVQVAELDAFTDRVGFDLVAFVEPGVPTLDWEFYLLDSDVINAFALPGGKIYMSRGLAERMTSEAQFAAVIGHEIGHVTARHGNQRISQQIGFNIAVAAGAIAVGVADEDSAVREYGQIGLPVLAVGGNLVLLSYGRDQELEADMLGVRYMAKAGYDPIGALEVQQLLKQASGGGAQGLDAFLSTHPPSDQRIDQIRSLLAGPYAYTQNNPEFEIHADRFEREFLSRLPPSDARRDDEAVYEFALSNPASWCAHCAASCDQGGQR